MFYGGASFRYLPVDFDPKEHIIVDPEIDVAWPISLRDLEPFYDLVERRVGVTDDEATPFSPSAGGERIIEAAERLGWSWMPTPLAINRAKCDRLSRCITYACRTGAKADLARLLLRPLVSAGKLDVISRCRALAMEMDGDFRTIERLRCLDLASNDEVVVRARKFLLACNAIQTAALLLRSRSPRCPSGVGNSSGLVGRTLCFKCSEYVFGIIPGGRTQPEELGPFSTVSVLQHYFDADCPTGLGGLIYEAAPEEAYRKGKPGDLFLRVETIIADHPRIRNCVRLAEETYSDGTPKVMLDYEVDRRDAARLEHMVGRCVQLLRAAGAEDIGRERSWFEMGSAHLQGTCRAGSDPRRSVVDAMGRMHDLDNVYVLDGSFMPFPGGLNPTLTIQANALRIASHIAQLRS